MVERERADDRVCLGVFIVRAADIVAAVEQASSEDLEGRHDDLRSGGCVDGDGVVRCDLSMKAASCTYGYICHASRIDIVWSFHCHGEAVSCSIQISH